MLRKNNYSWIFILGLTALVIVWLSAIFAISNLRTSLRYESASVVANDSAEDLNDILSSVISNQQSYLLTKDEEYLSYLQDDIIQIPKAILELKRANRIERIYNDDSQIIKLEDLIKNKIIFLKNLEDRDQKHRLESISIRSIIDAKQGIVEIRKILLDFKNNSKDAANNQTEFAKTYTLGLVIIITLGSIISILLLLVFVRRMRNEIHEKIQEKLVLEEARSAATQASVMKSKFLATVSHEIRTPLNGIIGLSDVLKRGASTPEQKRISNIIYESGLNLLKIINDILDFSKIESGNITLELAPFDVRNVVDQVFSVLSKKAEDKSIHLVYECDENIPCEIIGDSSRLSQIFFNLIGNAIKFTNAGSVRLKIKRDTSFSSVKKIARLIFIIEDTGVGISEDNLSHLFKPFIQLQKNGTSGEAGTGLGLSISQQLVKSMGGEIHVKSEEDFGTRFWFSLDLPFIVEETIGKDIKNYTHIKSGDESNTILPIFNDANSPLILIVDDNPSNQVTIQIIVQKLGGKTLVASNGLDAVSMASRHNVDLIFMDYQMPLMDGLEATKVLREKGINTYIIAMTANISTQDQLDCSTAGMNSFLAKPVTIDSISLELIKYNNLRNQFFNDNVLDVLESKLGKVGVTKIITAFKSTFTYFYSELDDFEINKDIEKLQRLGHRFASSSLMIGAIEFGNLCKKMEQETLKEQLLLLSVEVRAAGKRLEIKINTLSEIRDFENTVEQNQETSERH